MIQVVQFVTEEEEKVDKGAHGMMEAREHCSLVVTRPPCPLTPTPLLFEFLRTLSLPPTLCEITITIATRQIGLEITVVVGAIATHMLMSRSVTGVNVCRTHTCRHAQIHAHT